MRYTSYQIGRYGEDVAVKYLEQRGYRTVERNYRILRAEIDIITEKNGVLVFVEVKTRSNEDFGTGSEAVTPQKQKQIMKAAAAYSKSWSLVRFDVISVLLEKNKHSPVSITHYRNAFG